MQNFCVRCGRKLAGDENFCPLCATPVDHSRRDDERKAEPAGAQVPLFREVAEPAMPTTQARPSVFQLMGEDAAAPPPRVGGMRGYGARALPEQPLPPAQSAAQAKGKKGGAVVVLVLIAVMVVLVGVLVVALALRGRSDGGKPPAQQAGAAQAGPAMVGQPVSLDGVQYTVVRVEQQASGNNLYVMVELELENAGSKTVNAAYMISLVVDGYVYEKAHDEINMISAAGLDKLPNTANLGPGTKKRGGLIFKVPKDAAAMELVIDSGSSSIRIQLADGKQRAGLGSIRQVNP